MDRLAPQSWMTDPATRAVMAALEAEGGTGCARFVGGCVRNAILGEPVEDVDIATPLTPEQVMAALKRAGLKAAPTGIEHGTVTAISDHRPFEITTLRRDVETDGRRAVVAFTQDWAEDAQRRDFRLNALYAEGDGRLHDPTGGGVADALAGRIVFVGDAETRIREDWLRILRFFRFFAWYGRGEADPAGLEACGRLREGLTRLSAERVGKELLRLLAAPDPREAVRLMAGSGVLETALPFASERGRFEALVPLSREPELRLSALLADDPAAVAMTVERLRLSNAQRERLLSALLDETAVEPGMGERAARAALYRIGQQAFRDRLLRAQAVGGGDAGPLLSLAEGWERPRFPLGGADLKAAGLRAGPEMGRVLRELETAWIESDFQLDRDQLLARLER